MSTEALNTMVTPNKIERTKPAGIEAGAPLSVIDGPVEALALIAPELLEAEGHLHDLLISDVKQVSAIASYLASAGGKRLRPALTALAAKTIEYNEPISRLMCVGELIHLGSLLHDDVVDDGRMRRGRPAAHLVHGNAVAILSGDFCLARAVLLASEEGGHRAVHELGQVVTEMAEGEVLQLVHTGNLEIALSSYMDVISRKSAALIAWCAAAPAYASQQEEQAQALAVFGRSAGIAFQITDDILDYLPNTGKEPGADLREKKPTLPLLYALEEVPGLKEELTQTESTDKAITRWVQRIVDSGALERARSDAIELVEQATQALNALPNNNGRAALTHLARYLVQRLN